MWLGSESKCSGSGIYAFTYSMVAALFLKQDSLVLLFSASRSRTSQSAAGEAGAAHDEATCFRCLASVCSGSVFLGLPGQLLPLVHALFCFQNTVLILSVLVGVLIFIVVK